MSQRNDARALKDASGNIVPYGGAADGEFLKVSSGSIVGASAPATTPGGGYGTVQYNNAGSFDGAANLTIVGAGVLSHAREDEHVVISPPSVASTGYAYSFMGELAARAVPGFRGATGAAAFLQPAFFGRKTSTFMPGSTAAGSVVLTGSWSFTLPAGSSSSRQAYDNTKTAKLLNSVRTKYTSGAGANLAAGIYGSQDQCWRGNASGLGGFFCWFRFGWDVAPPSDCRLFVGLSANATASSTTANPSASVNSIGLAKDSADTKYQVLTVDATGGAGHFTKTALASGPAANDLIDVYLWAEPNGGYIWMRVVDVAAGSDLYASTAINSTLPASTAYLRAHVMGGTGPTTLGSIQFSALGGYMETEL